MVKLIIPEFDEWDFVENMTAAVEFEIFYKITVKIDEMFPFQCWWQSEIKHKIKDMPPRHKILHIFFDFDTVVRWNISLLFLEKKIEPIICYLVFGGRYIEKF